MTAAIVLITFFVSLAASWLAVLARRETLPWWAPVIGGVFTHFCWACSVRVSALSLVTLSAIFDVVVAVGFFLGFWWFGQEHISPVQLAGIALLCAGLILINR